MRNMRNMRVQNVPLLPNLVTTGNLFCGFSSVIYSFQGDFGLAAWLILAAMVFDFFDGLVARLQKATSEFGLEYDSLCDLVSFGVAPAVLVHQMFLQNMGRMGLGIAFLYTACAALRLARYNVKNGSGEKKAFLGLPSPAAAGMITSTILLEREIPEIYPEVTLGKFLPYLFLMVAFLMVSNFKYPVFKSVKAFENKPFINLVLIVAGASLALFQLEVFIFLCFLLYVLAGLWQEVQLQHQHHRGKSETEVHS